MLEGILSYLKTAFAESGLLSFSRRAVGLFTRQLSGCCLMRIREYAECEGPAIRGWMEEQAFSASGGEYWMLLTWS